ncbi:MAG: acyl-CoA dehydrogenase family protein [Dehalococcoidia bacterium]|jgi:butyryl-CoA dehydrogenase|nr:acyl-CoA dehydrogenase family protein [Dehalococcoidia bacterium]HAT21260.1 acyl-CoA dehydrogenase [Dehalococcoidia bacterium]HBF00785.1 acyl-CoA dehydrogenase [Dehalococcoidia bacterium]HBR64294.1 acyl-CoA dehydrogenase [Dehalococcoidia bacterium]|tara:strand:+ start:9779 stop:10930 length:1152 start_codon:yes stop_codon:yes gene_type:complete
MSDLLLSDDEILLKNTVSDYSKNELAPRAAGYDESGLFPWDNVTEIGELGLFGLTIPEEYGGSGGTTRQLAIAAEEIAKGCAATSVIYIAHLSLCTQFINMFGSEEQKRNYLPDLASGKKVGAFALSEPGAGSDAAAIKTSAVRSNGHYVVNGIKTWISNAPEASIFVTLATSDTSKNHKGIEALIVESNTEGIVTNQLHGKMGVRASTVGEIIFDNVLVPVKNRMGEDEQGFRQTMEVLNASRISIGAQCVGIAQAALEAAVDYAIHREAFGGPLSDLQGIQWMIAEMATEIEAARQLVMKSASLRDANLPFATEASMSKLYGSKVAMESAHKAVQIHGATGYFAPTPVERYFRDARVTEIYEGTSEIQKLVIAKNILKKQG